MKKREILEKVASGQLTVDQAEKELEQHISFGYINQLTDDKLRKLKVQLEPYVTSEFYTELDQYEELTHTELVNLIGNHLSTEYLVELDNLGLDISQDLVTKYALHDVNLEFLSSMIAFEFTDATPKRYLKARIHDVSTDNIAKFQELGLDFSLKKAIKMTIHGVTPEFCQSLHDMGYTDLTANILIALRIHNVSIPYIEYLQQWDYHPSLRLIKKMAIHDVSTDYITALSERGIQSLSGNDLIKARIHGLSPQRIDKLRQQFGDISVKHMIQLSIHDIDEVFVSDLATAGLDDLTINEIISLKIHGVDSSYILELKNAGLKNLTAKELIRCRNHGVTANLKYELSELGFSDIDLHTLTNLSIHNIDGDYIRSIFAAEIDDISLSEIKQFRIHGVTPNYINMFHTAAYWPSPQQLIQAKIHGVQQEHLNLGQTNNWSLSQVIRNRIQT